MTPPTTETKDGGKLSTQSHTIKPSSSFPPLPHDVDLWSELYKSAPEADRFALLEMTQK